MVQRTRRKRNSQVVTDHAALFAHEVKTIARGSGLLDAYRKSTGLLLREIRTEVARERLEQMGRRCHADYVTGQYNDLLVAREIAARHARLAYAGEWWTTAPCSAEPLILALGDEYFSRATVSAIIERMREPVADKVG